MSEEEKKPVDVKETKKEEKKSSGWGAAAPSKKDKGAAPGKGLLASRGKPVIHTEVSRKPDSENAVEAIPGEYSLDDKILFYKERECLLLLLEARKLLASMVAKKEEETARAVREKRRREQEEKKRTGRLNVQEIQDMLQNSPDEDDYDMVSEIQELKKQLVISMRQNHKLERDLAKLDKRIALLIKNRTNLQDVIAASKGLKSQKKGEITQMDPKKLENYQALFYLLQTEPRYLARCVYMINPQQLESFLETVILTLFGDQYSPREEYLILSLFKLSMEKEIGAIKALGDFIGGQAETVLPKMINSYNRRKQGLNYLKETLEPILNEFIKINLSLELNPLQVYQAMINEHEIKTGEPSPLPRGVSAEEAAENPDVKKIVDERLESLANVCQKFVDGIIKSLDKLPYGLRWLMKQLRDLCLKALPDTTEEDISKVIVYFVYYRFINLAIVQPDAYHIAGNDLPPIARKNLITASRVLQNLFNFRKFNAEKPGEKFFVPLNEFIDKNSSVIQEYVSSIYQVPEPEEKLQVNKYMELAQKAKPVIIISLHEIYKTHALLAENLSQLVTEEEDPLRVIMADLGPPPNPDEEDQDRELQLTLANRFKVELDEDSENQRLYAETKELVIPILRLVPVQSSIHRLSLMDVLEAGIKFATETNNASLKSQIKKILENLGKLEAVDVVSKEDNYESFVHDVALEVANRATIREQQRKEVARLKATLGELKEHQGYLDESIQSYQDYLQACKENQYAMAAKKKKKKGKKGASSDAAYVVPPVKFTYKELSKKRVIIDSDVPNIARKKTIFTISSDTPGIFDVDAKIAGATVEKMVLDFDDLLEKHYNNITKLELDQVTLDVNMTIHLINKTFLS